MKNIPQLFFSPYIEYEVKRIVLINLHEPTDP